MRLPDPLHTLADSVLHPGHYPLLPGRLSYAVRYLLWRRRIRSGPDVALEGPQKLTAILLSYKRIRNLAPIVEGLLRARFIDRIIVSNNNPEYRLRDWIPLKDDRLHLIDQPMRRPASIRFQLAKEQPGEYFISIDDDNFLHPAQVKQLFERLLARPDTPHGRQGENYVGSTVPTPFQGWQLGLRDFEGPVDVINCVYAFTREHVSELHRLARRLGLDLGTLSNGEDVLLSSSGQDRPLIHDVGSVLECLSSARRGVATWRTREDFFQERTRLLFALRALKVD